MALPFPHRSLGQPGELAADGGHAQHPAVLTDGLLLEIAHHAIPAQEDSSVS